MPRKPKNYADGKVKIEVKQPQVTQAQLDKIFNHTENPFKTLEKSVYSAKLKAMGREDLQSECQKFGLLPSQGDEILRERLLERFDNFILTLKAAEMRPIQVKETPEIKKILGDMSRNIL